MSEKVKLSPFEERNMVWNDISGLEVWREYVFSDGGVYRIDRPVMLNIKRDTRGDSHRVIDEFGVRHYIPPTWIGLRFGGEWGLFGKVERPV